MTILVDQIFIEYVNIPFDFEVLSKVHKCTRKALTHSNNVYQIRLKDK